MGKVETGGEREREKKREKEEPLPYCGLATGQMQVHVSVLPVTNCKLEQARVNSDASPDLAPLKVGRVTIDCTGDEVKRCV